MSKQLVFRNGSVIKYAEDLSDGEKIRGWNPPIINRDGQVLPWCPKRDRSQPVTIGEFIRARRESRGWTLRELSGRVERSESYVSDLERGKRDFTDDMIAQMSAVLEIPIDELYQCAGRLAPAVSAGLAARHVELGELLRLLAAGSVVVVRGSSLSDGPMPELSEHYIARMKEIDSMDPGDPRTLYLAENERLHEVYYQGVKQLLGEGKESTG